MIELKLFHAPLKYVVLNDINNDAVIEYCLNYQKNNSSREISNKGGFQSNDLLESVPELNDVFKNVVKYSNQEFSKYGKTNFYQSVINNAWININYKNSYNVAHDHPGCFYSFVYYAKVPKNSGNIIFYHPSPVMSHTWDCRHFEEERNMEDTVCYQVWKEPVERLLVMFPSWLKHSVDVNLQDEPRISVAINTVIEKI